MMDAGQEDVWIFSHITRELLQNRPGLTEVAKPKISLYRELQYPLGTHVGILQVDMVLTNFFPNTFSPLQDEQSQMVVLDRNGEMIRNPANRFWRQAGWMTKC